MEVPALWTCTCGITGEELESFNLIDVVEWSGLCEALFIAQMNYDGKMVSQLIADGVDVNRRDYVG